MELTPSKHRYFITLSYDGTRYHGWQIQPNGESVQERLQGALSTLLREEVNVTGAGRTDAGVHARMMVAHFDSAACFEAEEGINGDQLAYKLNKLLPYDIAVLIEPSYLKHSNPAAFFRSFLIPFQSFFIIPLIIFII